MATTIMLKNHNIPVMLPSGLGEGQLLSFRPFNEWISTLTRNLSRQSQPSHAFHSDPYKLRSINVQAFDSWRPQRIGFLKLIATISNGAGEQLPGGIFLRGGSVAMLVMMIPDDAAGDSDDERYVVMAVQPRAPAGSLAFVELPAGMVDDAGSFAGQAATEIKEELGMEIKEEELVCLSDLAGESRRELSATGTACSGGGGDGSAEGGTVDVEVLPEAMFPSVGGCDECIRLFAHERRVPRAQLAEWTGKLTGLRDKGEKITLKLVRMQELWKEGARDAKTLGALALWEGLRREGRV